MKGKKTSNKGFRATLTLGRIRNKFGQDNKTPGQGLPLKKSHPWAFKEAKRFQRYGSNSERNRIIWFEGQTQKQNFE
jgi:hypothetical protein